MKDIKKDYRIIAAYCRVSTDRQAEDGFGLDVQREKIESYLRLYDKDKEGIIEWFIDDGYSAKDMKRPELQRMLSMLKENKIKEIYVMKLDRFTRSVIDTYTLMKLILEHNAVLSAIMDRIDISTANGRMFVGFLAIIAQWERETIAERVKASNKEIASQGLYPYSQRPFGYNLVDKMLYINKEEYEVVRFIYKNTLKYKSLKKVVEMMNDEHLLGRVWSFKKVSNLMNSPLIRGHLINDNIKVFNHHVPLITEEEYELYKEALHRKVERTLPKHTFLFRNLIYCSECGERCTQTFTTNKKGKVYIYYKCKKCRTTIAEERLEWQVMYRAAIDYNSVKYKVEIKRLDVKYKSLCNKEEQLTSFGKYTNISLDNINKIYKEIDEEKKKLQLAILDYTAIHDLNYDKLDRRKKELLFSQLYSRVIVDFNRKEVVHFIENE